MAGITFPARDAFNFAPISTLVPGSMMDIRDNFHGDKQS
jgi:hypothetical protein